MVIINGGAGGMDPLVALPCGVGANPTLIDKPVFVKDSRHQWRQQWDGADGADRHC